MPGGGAALRIPLGKLIAHLGARVADPDSGSADGDAVFRWSPEDSAERMRRAIRAVNSACRVVERSIAGQERRRAEADARRAEDELQADKHADERAAHRESSRSAREALHVEVDAFVLHLRSTGDPPERMLVKLKTFLPRPSSHSPDRDDFDALIEDVVRWGIAAYYRSA